MSFRFEGKRPRISKLSWVAYGQYLARNFMKEMKRGDLAFFYHSNCRPPGIVGIMEIVQEHSTDGKGFSSLSLTHFYFTVM